MQPQQSAFPLHPYQQETLVAIRLAPVRGVFNPFVALPTGSGKNYLMPFVHLERGGRSLVLAQSERIVRQNARQFEQHGLNVGLLKSEIREYDADVVVSTVQTLVRPGHLAR